MIGERSTQPDVDKVAVVSTEHLPGPTRKRLSLRFSRSGVPLVRDASPEEIMRRSTS
ncbi:MAG: hypothetical protein JWQ03_3091 [Variovorax sp.]|nr:hypothetical protein [Variovorax sp.]